MKNFISLIFLILLSTSTANAAAAASVSRVDLYASCVKHTNEGQKMWMPKLFTAAQRDQLDPYQLKAIAQECACTVKEAFKYLSQDTIQAFNTSMEKGIGDIIPSKTKASVEFQKNGMGDKVVACNEQAQKSSGVQQKIMELSKK